MHHTPASARGWWVGDSHQTNLQISVGIGGKNVSGQPWDFDYELQMTNVIALARACGLRGEVTPLGAGFDHANFRCDDQVLRIPKRAERAALLLNELAVLRAMPADLPLLLTFP